LEFKYLKSDLWDKWDNFLHLSQQGTIFQSSKYLQIYSSAFKREVKIGTVLQNNQILGGVVCLPNKKYGIPYLSQPYLIPYNGIILKEFSETSFYQKKLSKQNKVYNIILSVIEKQYKICSLHQTNFREDLRLPFFRGWQFEPHYTVKINLGKVITHPTQFIAKDQRRRIRTLEKKDLQFNLKSDTSELYDLVNLSYSTHNLKFAIPRSHFIHFVNQLLEEKVAKCFSLSIGGQTVCSILVLEDFPRLFALFSGKLEKPDFSSSELFLIWKVMKEYGKQKFEEFDLLGAMVPSIAKIKIDLGGNLVRSDQIKYFRNKIYQLLFNLMVFKKQRERVISK
jgi:hypothetical protein